MAPLEAEPSSPPPLERATIQNGPPLLHWRLEASGLMAKGVALKATKHFRYPSDGARARHGSQVNALWMLMVMRDAPGCVMYLRLPLDKTTNSVILVPVAQMTKISMPEKMCPCTLRSTTPIRDVLLSERPTFKTLDCLGTFSGTGSSTPSCLIFLPPMLFTLPGPLLCQYHLLLKSPFVTRQFPRRLSNS